MQLRAGGRTGRWETSWERGWSASYIFVSTSKKKSTTPIYFNQNFLFGPKTGWCSSSRNVKYDWLATLAKNKRPNNWNNDLDLKTIEAAYNNKQKQVIRAATLAQRLLNRKENSPKTLPRIKSFNIYKHLQHCLQQSLIKCLFSKIILLKHLLVTAVIIFLMRFSSMLIRSQDARLLVQIDSTESWPAKAELETRKIAATFAAWDRRAQGGAEGHKLRAGTTYDRNLVAGKFSFG